MSQAQPLPPDAAAPAPEEKESPDMIVQELSANFAKLQEMVQATSPDASEALAGIGEQLQAFIQELGGGAPTQPANKGPIPIEAGASGAAPKTPAMR